MKLSCIHIIAFISASLFSVSNSWNLAHLGLAKADYRISHVSVFYVRAFLCIRPSRTPNNNRTMAKRATAATVLRFPTLIETSWPENVLPVQPRAFPGDMSHANNDRQCNGIIRALGTAVDMNTGDLWLLDRGSRYCAPKVITIDLIGNNEETHRNSFPRMPFASIHTGPVALNGSRIFLTLFERDFIIVYGPKDRKWWKLKFITPNDMIVVPKAITWLSNDNMYIVDAAQHLWLTPKALTVTSSQQQTCRYFELPVVLVDDLMGTATSMVVDPADKLYYYMPKDGAVVRWDTSKPLRAENHDILYFTANRVIAIVFGAKGSVWAIEDRPGRTDDHCHRIISHFTGSTKFNQNHLIYRRMALYNQRLY